MDFKTENFFLVTRFRCDEHRKSNMSFLEDSPELLSPRSPSIGVGRI